MKWAMMLLLAACTQSGPQLSANDPAIQPPPHRLGWIEKVHRLGLSACQPGWSVVPIQSTPLHEPIIVHEDGVDDYTCRQRWLALAERCPAYVPEHLDGVVRTENATTKTRRKLADCIETAVSFGLQYCDTNAGVLPISEYPSHEDCLAHATKVARRCDRPASER